MVFSILCIAEFAFAQQAPNDGAIIKPPPQPLILPDDYISTLDSRVNLFLGIPNVRKKYKLSGKGLSVAIIDTGLNIYHKDFQGKIIAAHNFSPGKVDNVADENGHGSNVASIIAAKETSSIENTGGLHSGIAPEAGIVALKVFPNPLMDLSLIDAALQWIIDHHKKYQISVVNLSAGIESGPYANLNSDLTFSSPNLEKVREKIKVLRANNIPVVVSAGNQYHKNNDRQGMSFPAICRETVSVGAMYDTTINGEGITSLYNFADGSVAFRVVSGRCTPFTQRLSAKIGGPCKTDIFASGFQVSGACRVLYKLNSFEIDVEASTSGSSLLDGTSQACPVVSGMILLLQEYYIKINNSASLPSVDLIEQILWDGGAQLNDFEDEIGKAMDNVVSTGETFRYAQAARTFEALTNPSIPSLVGATQIEPNVRQELGAIASLKLKVASALRKGQVSFPKYKPQVRFFAADRSQKEIIREIFKVADEKFKPISIFVTPTNAFKPEMVEVRFMRYPEDQPVAEAMAELIKEKFHIKNVRTSFTLRSAPPEKEGDIEVWFPRKIHK